MNGVDTSNIPDNMLLPTTRHPATPLPSEEHRCRASLGHNGRTQRSERRGSRPPTLGLSGGCQATGAVEVIDHCERCRTAAAQQSLFYARLALHPGSYVFQFRQQLLGCRSQVVKQCNVGGASGIASLFQEGIVDNLRVPVERAVRCCGGYARIGFHYHDRLLHRV